MLRLFRACVGTNVPNKFGSHRVQVQTTVPKFPNNMKRNLQYQNLEEPLSITSLALLTIVKIPVEATNFKLADL
jgi:hypothetical protein